MLLKSWATPPEPEPPHDQEEKNVSGARGLELVETPHQRLHVRHVPVLTVLEERLSQPADIHGNVVHPVALEQEVLADLVRGPAELVGRDAGAGRDAVSVKPGAVPTRVG